ncbi:MAG: RNA polymerase sigma factor [Bacteroidia bacterium]|nr:RNA polymerase sigma factor [Bacteroidia bacterium]
MTDEQLVEAILRQDASAQRLLYDRYARRMFGVCLRYAKGREEAEDLLQEGFIKVFQKISSFKAQGSLEGWIRRVMVNTALDYLRQQKLVWTELDEINDPGEDPSIGEQLGAREILVLVQKLPAGFRTIFNLYAIEGFSHREIAGMLDISEGTSKSQYSRARSQLISLVNELNKESSLTAR